MPFTPYHFGPGLLVKAALPWHFSFTAFATTEVLVDVEVLVNLVRETWPVHTKLHSLAGALSVGIVVGVVTHMVGTTVANRWLPGLKRRASLSAEFALWPSLLGGILGGLGASLLDAIMHSDVQPLWPFSTRNDLLGTIGLGPLHVGCMLAAIVGAVVLLWRERRAGWVQ